jgi:hypothetical protein
MFSVVYRLPLPKSCSILFQFRTQAADGTPPAPIDNANRELLKLRGHMPEPFTIRVSSAGTLDDAFGDIPEDVKRFFKRGFALLPRIPQEKYGELIVIAAANLESSHLAPKVPSEVASLLNVTELEAVSLLGVASVVMSVMTQRQEGPEDFVGAAQKAGMLEPAAVQAATAFAGLVRRDRDSLSLIVERARVGVEVLPSFRRIATTTDVRLGFKKGSITVAVPVTIALLMTDSGKSLWFQLTKGQLERAISDLQEAKQELEAAEEWTQRSAGGSG